MAQRLRAIGGQLIEGVRRAGLVLIEVAGPRIRIAVAGSGRDLRCRIVREGSGEVVGGAGKVVAQRSQARDRVEAERLNNPVAKRHAGAAARR